MVARLIAAMMPMLAALPAVAAQQSPEQQRRDAQVLSATKDLATGHGDAAITRLDPVIAAYDKDYANEKRMLFCASDPTEAILYMTLGAAAKRDAVAIAATWCEALFMKGFALSDVKRFPEAQTWIERAIAKRPNHAHYLNELGYVLQQQRLWQPSYDAFARAAGTVPLGDKGRDSAEKGRALRGMGFALIEQGKWDEAEAKFKEALALDPGDTRAKNELKYIAENRLKAT